MSILDNINNIREQIVLAAQRAGRDPSEILLVAAAKTKGPEAIREAIDAGVYAVGENRVQEMRAKRELGAYEGARLHFIGQLQKNKVKYVVGVCDLIESVDSLALLKLIDRRAASLGTVQDVLLEINIAGEATKAGLSPGELPEILDNMAYFPCVRVRGIMAIPPVSRKPGGNRAWFSRMYKLFVDIGAKKYDNICMDFLSMGMSGDFPDAIAEGANMIRLGTAIFGSREQAPA
ncbi:MAG TPA: YggS family pyridoxal phosphate-dependent enzyme [Clostridiales bacterium]|jgi:pyridoxal phosphate enzyme (YggS family)|nr:YggS family pyridoxal phosphate-dependent enzyme [Clostridiales bacterium]